MRTGFTFLVLYLDMELGRTRCGDRKSDELIGFQNRMETLGTWNNLVQSQLIKFNVVRSFKVSILIFAAYASSCRFSLPRRVHMIINRHLVVGICLGCLTQALPHNS